MPRKAPTRRRMIEKLDRAFSRYIRKKYANHGGWCTCITCKLSVPWEDIHAGHFIPRGNHSTRWDTRNVHPQCCSCNTFRDTGPEYALYILQTYGQDTLEDLLRLKRVEKRWKMDELRELLEQYDGK